MYLYTNVCILYTTNVLYSVPRENSVTHTNYSLEVFQRQIYLSEHSPGIVYIVNVMCAMKKITDHFYKNSNLFNKITAIILQPTNI